MANKIQVKRGKEVNLPILDVGEPAFTTDTKKPFIGSDTGNIELATKEQINSLEAELIDKVSCATRVIAASNSLETSKKSAHYVCDGINDEQEIRSALKDILNLSNGWNHYIDTPVMPFGDFGFVWYDGSTYHCYSAYNNSTKIGHSTSIDGKIWVNDVEHNPVLTVGTGWDNSVVGVFMPWKENSTWYALYRGNGNAIGLATSPDGVTWTKSASNPVISGDAGSQDPAGLIKVGSTYYLYTNNTGGDRQINVWTSTNLTAWVKTPVSPIMMGDRYCSSPFKYNGYYYLLVSKYYDSRVGGVIELYRDTSPLFAEGQREFLGVVIFDPTRDSVDTPSVVTNTITRDTFPNDELWCYYSKKYSTGYASYPAFLTIETDIVTALTTKVVKPGRGKVCLLDGTYNINCVDRRYAFDITYGNILEGNNSILKLADGSSQDVTDVGMIFVDRDSVIRDVYIDGNNTNVTGNQTGIVVSKGGLAENIKVYNWNYKGAQVSGTISKSKIYHNVSQSIWIAEKGKAIDCKIFGNGNSAQLYSDGIIEMCEIYNNILKGIVINGVKAKIVGGTINNNGAFGADISANNHLIIIGCHLYNNKGYSNRGQLNATGKLTMFNCILEDRNNIQAYNVYLADGSSGHVLGNNMIKSGSVAQIYDGSNTMIAYNNNVL